MLFCRCKLITSVREGGGMKVLDRSIFDVLTSIMLGLPVTILSQASGGTTESTMSVWVCSSRGLRALLDHSTSNCCACMASSGR